MRHIILTLILPLISLVAAAQQTTLTGIIKPHQATDTLLIYVQGSSKEGYDTLHIDKKGRFTYTTDLTQMSEALVFTNIGQGSQKAAFCVLLQPGKNMHVEVARQPFNVKYSGFEAEKSVYANQYYQNYSRSYKFDADTLAALHASFAAARTFIDTEIAKMETTVKAISDTEFATQARAAIADQRLSSYFSYAIGSEKIGRKMEQDPDFMAYVSTINPNDTTQCSAVYLYLEWYYQAHPDLYTPMSSQGAKLKYLGQYTKNQEVRNKVANIYMSNLLFLAAWGMDTAGSELKDMYEQYLAVCSDTTYAKFAKDNLARIAQTAPGELPIDFTLEDTQGQPTTFASLMGNGHVTYIDFWATWCGPCKAEIPHLAKMVADYKEKNMLYSADNPQGQVRIISISIDSDRAAWLSKVAKDNPQWEQYIVPDLQNCPGLTGYNINSIPRFMLFDTSGRLFKSAASRPSDTETRVIIDGMLNK